MNIYLIRHGQTTMNASGHVFSGSSDVSLSQHGIETTKKVAESPIWDSIEKVFVTSLKRSRETADIIFGDRLPRGVLPELSEVDFGEYEGRVHDYNVFDPVFHQWVHCPEVLTFPGGENMVEHTDKAIEALINMANEEWGKCENVAVVAHATTIRLILSKVMTGTIRHFRAIPCDNSSANIMTYSKEKGLRAKAINQMLL